VAPIPRGVDSAVVFVTLSPLPLTYVIVNPVAPPSTPAAVAAVVIVATNEIRHIPAEGVVVTRLVPDKAATWAVFIDVLRIDETPCFVVAFPAIRVTAPEVSTFNLLTLELCKSKSRFVPVRLVRVYVGFISRAVVFPEVVPSIIGSIATAWNTAVPEAGLNVKAFVPPVPPAAPPTFKPITVPDVAVKLDALQTEKHDPAWLVKLLWRNNVLPCVATASPKLPGPVPQEMLPVDVPFCWVKVMIAPFVFMSIEALANWRLGTCTYTFPELPVCVIVSLVTGFGTTEFTTFCIDQVSATEFRVPAVPVLTVPAIIKIGLDETAEDITTGVPEFVVVPVGFDTVMVVVVDAVMVKLPLFPVAPPV
jgi:hypothetical protein